MVNLDFYRGKRVFVTGHTGFKGTWLTRILVNAGAIVTGYSLEPNTDPSLYRLANVDDSIDSVTGDVRDYESLKRAFDKAKPEIVMHLAAQPIVRESYKNPAYTYETNVMGTVNILECVRTSDCVKSFLNVTTDKVYFNDEKPDHAFKEEEPLDGFDPYSNSKSCSELVTHSYKKSFFSNGECAISTARAGNVLGGGDFSVDRIIPDCVRAALSGQDVIVRNPYSTRPYQHVLEPLFVYLEICEKQYSDGKYAGYYNVGPDLCDCVTTGELVDLFCKEWSGIKRVDKDCGGPHEAAFLQLSNEKIKSVFGWQPRWHIDETIKKVVEWTRVWMVDPTSVPKEMDREIAEFTKGIK